MRRALLSLCVLGLASGAHAAPPLPRPMPAAPTLPAGGQDYWLVDQLTLDASVGVDRLQALKDDHSMAAVIAHLGRLGIGFTRARTSLASAWLAPDLARQLRGLPPGEPFITPYNGRMTVNVLLSEQSGRPPKDVSTWLPTNMQTPDTAHLAAARRFLDAALPPAERESFFGRIVDATMLNMVSGIVRGQNLAPMLQQHAGLRAVMGQFVARQRQLALTDLHDHLSDLIAAQTIGYARLFSVEELDRLGVFFATPLGRKYLQEAQALTLQPELAAWQQGVAARAQQRMPAEIQRLTQDIQAEMAKEKPGNAS